MYSNFSAMAEGSSRISEYYAPTTSVNLYSYDICNKFVGGLTTCAVFFIAIMAIQDPSLSAIVGDWGINEVHLPKTTDELQPLARSFNSNGKQESPHTGNRDDDMYSKRRRILQEGGDDKGDEATNGICKASEVANEPPWLMPAVKYSVMIAALIIAC